MSRPAATMNICVVGGIFGSRGADPEKLKITPETTLVAGLRERGHTVWALGHYEEPPAAAGIVHVHHLSYGALRAACLASDARLVFTSHDGPSLCGYSRSPLRRLASRFVMARADAVVALSRAEALFQQNAYRIEGAQHCVIPNGIPPAYAFHGCTSRGNGSPWRLLFVGQLTQLKRVDTLLEAVALLKVQVHLSLAYHNATMEQPLRQLAGVLGIQHRISFIGPCQPERLAQLYRDSDMLILPSEAESLPSVVSEALLCGLPVVATRVGGIPDQVGDFGQLIRPGDAPGLAAAIASVCSAYSAYAARAAATAKQAAARYSIPAMIDAHLDLYEAVLQTARARRHSYVFAPGNFACQAALHFTPKAQHHRSAA